MNLNFSLLSCTRIALLATIMISATWSLSKVLWAVLLGLTGSASTNIPAAKATKCTLHAPLHPTLSYQYTEVLQEYVITTSGILSFSSLPWHFRLHHKEQRFYCTRPLCLPSCAADLASYSDALTLMAAGGRKSIRYVTKIELWVAGAAICLKHSAINLRMVQLMPLPPHHLLLY